MMNTHFFGCVRCWIGYYILLERVAVYNNLHFKLGTCLPAASRAAVVTAPLVRKQMQLALQHGRKAMGRVQMAWGKY